MPKLIWASVTFTLTFVAGVSQGAQARGVLLTDPPTADLPDIVASSLEEPVADIRDVRDPWEKWNRRMFAVHERIDMAMLAPAARTWKKVPPNVRKRFVSFGENAKTPVHSLQSLLQGNFKGAASSSGRFLINSTLGVGGLFDPASRLGLKPSKIGDEDFGQTLGVWGVPSGPYLFVPVMGPTTVRDQFGRVGGAALDPTNYLPSGGGAVGAGATTFKILELRAKLLDPIDEVRAVSVDPYTTFKNAYLRSRQAQIENKDLRPVEAPVKAGLSDLIPTPKSLSPGAKDATQLPSLSGSTKQTPEPAKQVVTGPTNAPDAASPQVASAPGSEAGQTQTQADQAPAGQDQSALEQQKAAANPATPEAATPEAAVPEPEAKEPVKPAPKADTPTAAGPTLDPQGQAALAPAAFWPGKSPARGGIAKNGMLDGWQGQGWPLAPAVYALDSL